MIRRLIQQQTFDITFLETKQELENTIDKKKRITIQWINGKEGNSGDKLFDRSNQFEDDQYTAIPDGAIENFSSRVDLSNIQYPYIDFYGRKIELRGLAI